MPCDYNKYVPYWRQFSEFIRFERAENYCECRGECGTDHAAPGERCNAINGGIGAMGRDGVWQTTEAIHNLNSSWGETLYPNFDMIGSKVVLTVAHLDRKPDGICRCEDETGRKCAKPEHVKAMCQRCHLVYDKDRHAANRRKTMASRNDNERGLFEAMLGR